MPRPRRAAGLSLLIGLIVAVTAPVALAAPGDLDTGFGTGGVFTAPFMTTFPGAEDSHTVAVDSLGRVYLSATQEPQLNGGPLRQVNVVRLTPQGVPDPSFGTGGTATLPTSGDVRNAGIVVDGLDRPIVLTNNGENAADWRIGLTRLTTGGQPDPSFDGDGVVESALPGAPFADPWPAGVALDSNGGILVVGTLMSCTPTCTRVSGFVARFGSGGALDSGYGTGGWTAIADTGTEMAAIQALPGGGAVVGGYRNYADFVAARLTATGALDTGFDGDGVAFNNLGKQSLDIESAYGVTADLQGRPVVVGQFTHNGNGAVVAARWTNGGAPDPSFGTGSPATGVVLLPASGGRAVDAAPQCVDGKLLVAAIGALPMGVTNRLLLSRLNDDGTLDATFAPSAATPGVASMAAGDLNTATDIALIPGGAYVSGFRRQNASMVFTDYPQVTRFLANDGCGTAPVVPPVIPPVANPPAAAPPVAKPSTPAKLSVASVVTFPPTKACVSRRRFKIRLRVPKSANVVQADVRVNGKRVAVRRGDRLRSTVDLRSLPKGRFSVQIVLKLKSGATVKGIRRYKTCVPKVKRRAARHGV